MARFCGTCGTPLSVGTSSFCTKCGAAVAASPITSATTASPSVLRSAGSSRNDKTLPANGPKPVVAGILAGFFPFGVGAVYIGQYAKGWVYLLISVVLTLGMSQSFPVGRIALLVYAFYFVWQIIDAVRAAKAMRSAGGITNLSAMKRAVSVGAMVLTLVAVTAARVLVEDRLGKTTSAVAADAGGYEEKQGDKGEDKELHVARNFANCATMLNTVRGFRVLGEDGPASTVRRKAEKMKDDDYQWLDNHSFFLAAAYAGHPAQYGMTDENIAKCEARVKAEEQQLHDIDPEKLR